MGRAIKHPVPDRFKLSFVIFDIQALWRSALIVRVPDIKNYKWRLNPVWHRMLYIAVSIWQQWASVKGLTKGTRLPSENFLFWEDIDLLTCRWRQARCDWDGGDGGDGDVRETTTVLRRHATSRRRVTRLRPVCDIRQVCWQISTTRPIGPAGSPLRRHRAKTVPSISPSTSARSTRWKTETNYMLRINELHIIFWISDIVNLYLSITNKKPSFR